MMNTLTQSSAKRGIPTIEAMENSHPTQTEEKHPDSPPLSKSISTEPVVDPEQASAPIPDWRPYQASLMSGGGSRVLSYLGTSALTVFIFLALPITQLLSEKGVPASTVVMESVSIPPPPPPPPDPPSEKEEIAEVDIPELEKDLQPLDLSQLDIALNPGVGGALNMSNALFGFGVTPDTIAQMDIFELNDLDNDPQRIVAIRPIYPFAPKRDKINGWVKLIIIIDERGKVIKADAESSSHREFEKSGIEAVLQWCFEPGTRHGKPVKVRKRQGITFQLG